MTFKVGARFITEVDVSPLGGTNAGSSDPGEEVDVAAIAVRALLEPRALFLETMLATLPENVFFKDAQGRYLRISQHMASWLGLADPSEAVGKTDAAFFSSERATQSFVED